jgi:hypothetical protein
MNAWPFIIAAYAFSLAAIVLLVGMSWAAMRRAESEAAKLSRDHEA